MGVEDRVTKKIIPPTISEKLGFSSPDGKIDTDLLLEEINSTLVMLGIVFNPSQEMSEEQWQERRRKILALSMHLTQPEDSLDTLQMVETIPYEVLSSFDIAMFRFGVAKKGLDKLRVQIRGFIDAVENERFRLTPKHL